MSLEAIIWADDVVGDALDVDVVSRAILSKLAGVSDDHDCAWMTVPTLAKRVGVSERTIQMRLRRLVRARGEMAKGDAEPGLALLRPTGRTYRHGTRTVPYYELQVDHVAVAALIARRKASRDAVAMGRPAMGAAVCTHGSEADDAVCTPMGAAVCTPYETNREEEEANASSAGARAHEAFRQIVDLWPISALDSTDLAAAEVAIEQAVEETGDPDLIVEVVRAAVADMTGQKRDFALPALDRWLARATWRERVKRVLAARAAPPSLAAAAMPAFSGPAELQAAVVGVRGEAFARSWLGRAEWDGERRMLTVGPTAHERLRIIWTDPAIAGLNITLQRRSA